MNKSINILNDRILFLNLIIVVIIDIIIITTGFYFIWHVYKKLFYEFLILGLFITPLLIFLLYVRKLERKSSLKLRVLQVLKHEIDKSFKEKMILETYLIQLQRLRTVEEILDQIADNLIDMLSIISEEIFVMLPKVDDKNLDSVNLKRIERDILQASFLSRQILLMDRKVEYKNRLINLNDELLDVLKLMEHSIPDSIKIELFLEEDIPPIYADPDQIKEMITNLVLNARDAMQAGGILTIKTKTIEIMHDFTINQTKLHPGEYIQLTVSDTGAGIGRKNIQHIYEPYFTTKDFDSGKGLGLSIVFDIVKNHGGNISCYSVPKIGTTFQIYLPINDNKLQTYDSYDKSIESRRSNNYNGKTSSILVVDDENAIRKTVKTVLEDKGYKVITAENGLQAIEVYKEHIADINFVIIDYQMPIMNGYDCMIELLKINPDLRIILSSGSKEDGDIKNAIALSDAYLRKPYDIEELFNCIKKVMSL